MARRSPARVIGGRLLQALPVILLATFMVFALLKLVPGDIAVTLAGDNATDARIAEIRSLYGLDRPFLVQYGAWLGQCGAGRSFSIAADRGEGRDLDRTCIPEHTVDRGDRAGAGAGDGHSDGHRCRDQAERLDRQD